MKFLTAPISAGITGFESPSTEYQQLPLSLDALLLRHPNSSFIGKASGDSMINVGIFDGDLLIVDRSLTATQGAVIVGNVNGEFFCKLFDRQNRRLLSANPAYPPVDIKELDVFTVEGVVTSTVRLHQPITLGI